MHSSAREIASPLRGDIIRTIPKACFQKNELKAFLTLTRDFSLALAIVAAIVWVDNWWIAVPLSFLLGTVLTGIFVLGHDAGHRSFSNRKWVNNLVGHATTSWTLWPFHVWRRSHDVHHRYTHHATEDIAWNPLTIEEYNAQSWLVRFFYRSTRTWAFTQASILFKAVTVWRSLNREMFGTRYRYEIISSVIITACIGLLYAGLASLAGVYGFVTIFLLPILGFHFWLSVMTLFHHTKPDVLFENADEWQATTNLLDTSLHIQYPRWVDWLTHDISWHIAHHISVGIPFYSLRTAHDALQDKFPEHVREEKLSWSYLRSVLKECQLITSREDDVITWRTFGDAQAAKVNTTERCLGPAAREPLR